MIELLTADTPNGKKISIMLEEIGLKYKVTKINIYKDEQFKTEFRKISPFSKIPVIIDHDNNKEASFESGAILLYLAEISGGKFLPQDSLKRSEVIQWLMFLHMFEGQQLCFSVRLFLLECILYLHLVQMRYRQKLILIL